MVGKSLVDFQSKVSLIVKAIRLAFDDPDLVVHPFDFAGVNGVRAVVENAISAPLQRLGESGHRRVVQGPCRGAPLVEGGLLVKSRLLDQGML